MPGAFNLLFFGEICCRLSAVRNIAKRIPALKPW
jgi:hypothetical protein